MLENMNLTKAVEDWTYSWAEESLAYVWQDIETTPLNTTRERWIAKFANLAEDFVLSSRFALIRILYRRLKENEAFQKSPEFAMVKELAESENSSVVRELTEEQNRFFLYCLRSMADIQKDSNPAADHPLILRAWNHRISGSRKDVLSREEALRLGHVLGLSLTEMEWYLLRVLDTEDGLRYNQSEDLIHAYGFLTGAGWKKTETLIQWYQEHCAGIPKQQAERQERMTQSLRDGLPGNVERWQKDPVRLEEKFKEWMTTKAPFLDMTSVTARRIYRNLAVYTYELVKKKEESKKESDEESGNQTLDPKELDTQFHQLLALPGESDAVRKLLYEDGNVSKAKCTKVAAVLLKDNMHTIMNNATAPYESEEGLDAVLSKTKGSKEYLENEGGITKETLDKYLEMQQQNGTAVGKSFVQNTVEKLRLEESLELDTDRAKFWRVPTLANDNAFSYTYGIVNEDRDRVLRLLMGEDAVNDGGKKRKNEKPDPNTEVNKGDILYLIWSLCNHAWDNDIIENEKIVGRIDAFRYMCEDTLDAALLPEFYPPHLAERIMIMSIIYGSKSGLYSDWVYMSILLSLKGTRNRENKGVHHSEEEWRNFVDEYRDDEEHTLKEFADSRNISRQRLSYYKKLDDERIKKENPEKKWSLRKKRKK